MKPTTNSRALPTALALMTLAAAGCGEEAGPPVLLPPVLGPTSFIDPDIIVSTDPTALTSLVANGQGSRTMYDGRTGAGVTVDAWLFDAGYDDGLQVEVQVNPEFGDSLAAVLAAKYSEAFGRLPNVIRDGVEMLWIHDGVADIGSDDDAIWLHVGQVDQYEADGFLEESLVPAAVRATIQSAHGASAGWLEAQAIDNRFISQIAEDNPDTEDVAQSFLPYFTVVHRSSRVTHFLAATIVNAIPARLNYFADQAFDMHPLD